MTGGIPEYDSLLFAVPWAEAGRWVWESEPSTRAGAVMPLAGDGMRGLREIRSALRQRHRLQCYRAVFTWELRCTLAVTLALGRRRPTPRLIAVAPVVKGIWAWKRKSTAALLSRADRVVWMSEWERSTWTRRLSLESDRMLVDQVPGIRPKVRRPCIDTLDPDAPLIAIGNSNRDWRTLDRALARLPGTAHVVASGPNRMSTKNKADWIGTVPETDALKRLAESGIHVLCLRVADYGCGQSALVRALMEGVPTIATDIPVLAEYLPQFGVVSVPPGDPIAIGDAVKRWRSNPELWRHAREDAFKFAMRFEHAPFARRMALIATELD